jgi:glycosyltransferase involved in cell wall biosynthesis
MSKIISILIPCFNAAPYISKTLVSVLEQSFTNWECIIIDDHSTDYSFEIINSFCEKYPDKFAAFTNSGQGACAARNYAFNKSNGDYIQYLDSDDLITPNKLLEQMKFFNLFGDNIITNCKWGRFTNNHELVRWEQQAINKDYDTPITWLTDSWMGKGMSANSCWLTPRHLIEKAGPWDEGLRINQDGEFFCRVLLQAQSIKFSTVGGVYYRSGIQSSITQANSQSRTKAESLLLSYKSYERVLAVHDNKTIRKALGNNYINFIYKFYSYYPDLAKQAEVLFLRLGFKKMWSNGGKNFKILAKIIGFKNGIILRKLLHK